MYDVIVEKLHKTYNKKSLIAVDQVSFSVKKGEIFGLIGPDGAGKTSLFRMLTTLLLPDSGNASVNGYDIIKDYKSIRSKIGYMPGKFSLYQDLTIEENLNFFATVFNTTVEENYDLIKDIYVQIEPFKDRRAGKLSGGMKQKLALCCALIHRPTVLFLDEPTTGVDSVSRKEFWEILKRLKHEGITILVSTPYMDEASMCERIALIQNGKIMSIDTPEGITDNYPSQLYAIKGSKMSNLLNELRKNTLIDSAISFGEFHHITMKNNNHLQKDLLFNQLKNKGISDLEIHPIKATVEDCFIQFMLNNNSNTTNVE
ncbi:ABC transporter ATP-binding protein [Flavobacterium sp. NRK F10]|uniref:ABC transporter ATP-binding protein n=1 Tax=Flavobacterium sp. NRK F10 TaxID=2954931 RepID=UPI0020912385|nr:ABC transporter ATP-binding protein [Flavobacterium sp. NRK F10]MCO6175915.1 ABC transporter ATP-binding protein [Flavobacterium sp. NRK F10]